MKKRMALPLPDDAVAIRKLAARSMFDLFSSVSQGMMLVDRAGRVVWINDGYKRFLPALGFARSRRISSAARSRKWCRTR